MGDFLPGISYRGFPIGDVLQRMFYTGDVLPGFPTGNVLHRRFYKEYST
jgi:hypothetical protein